MLIKSKDWPEIERAISCGDIPTFSTKAAMKNTASKFGWSDGIRIQRRFETVWLCGKKDLQPDCEGGIEFDVIRVPLLRWEVKEGTQVCPVVKFRKAA